MVGAVEVMRDHTLVEVTLTTLVGAITIMTTKWRTRVNRK